MHALSENYITEGRLMRKTIYVARVTVQEYICTYRGNLRKLHILIRFKDIVDTILRFIHTANDNF